METIIKNKNADMNVMIMVFMALVIFISMLFIFIINQKQVINNFASPQVIELAYSEENLIRFYLTDLGENALATTYSEEGITKNSIFFTTKFEDNFNRELNSNQDIPSLKYLKEKGKVEISYDNENIYIEAKQFKITESSVFKRREMIKILKFIPSFQYEEIITQLLGISYSPDIKVSIPL